MTWPAGMFALALPAFLHLPRSVSFFIINMHACISYTHAYHYACMHISMHAYCYPCMHIKHACILCMHAYYAPLFRHEFESGQVAPQGRMCSAFPWAILNNSEISFEFFLLGALSTIVGRHWLRTCSVSSLAKNIVYNRYLQ